MTAKQLCAKLRAAGVTRVTAAYSGSGDEGNVEDVTAYGPPAAGREPGDSQPRVRLPDATRDLVRDWVYAALEDKQSGWEINDGSSGTATVDVADGTVQFEHYNLEPVEDDFTVPADDDIPVFGHADEDEEDEPAAP